MANKYDEPWHVDSCRGGWELCYTLDGKEGHVATFPNGQEEWANRAALCVNACIGMADTMPPGFVKELMAKANALLDLSPLFRKSPDPATLRPDQVAANTMSKIDQFSAAWRQLKEFLARHPQE